MRICMLGLGTRGDIQPLLVLGSELLRRGHSIVLTASDDLAVWARRSGLDVVSNGMNMRDIVHAPGFVRAVRRGAKLAAARYIVAQEARANASIMRASIAAAGGADLVLSTPLTLLRGQCLRDATGAHHFGLALFPLHPTAEFASFAAPSPDMRPLNLTSYQLFFDALWSQQRESIAQMCSVLGLAPYRRRPRVESVPSVCCFSDALVGKPREWARHEVVGWLSPTAELRTRLGEVEIPDALEAWLRAGPAPVYFGFGSMPVVDRDATLGLVRGVSDDLGVRALISLGPGETSDARPGGVRFFLAGTIDHDRVFTRCRAAVHHGGSGTVGAALRAGIPSVVVSFFADQPMWGWFIERAEAGAALPYRSLNRESLRRALEYALRPAVAERSQDLGARVRAEHPAARAADVIEAWTAPRRRKTFVFS